MTEQMRDGRKSAESELFSGDSEMSRLMRAHDWAATPVGPIARWPRSLQIVVRLLLDSRYAMWLGWGPDFTFFYNDAYARMSLGAKHPWALGRSAREVWAEIWDDIGPRAESVVRTGTATWDERLRLFLERRGFPEETYHTFSYSPVQDDQGGVGGMLCVVTEDTERVIGERRLRTLRELGARTTEEARSAEDACRAAAGTLAANPHDLPFALLYLIDADARTARLAGATGLPPHSPAAPASVDLTIAQRQEPCWPLHTVLHTGRPEVALGVRQWLGSPPVGPWPELPHTAAVLPVRKSGQERLAGFLVAGVSPRRPFDDDYRGFLDLLAGQIASAVTNARAYEEEKRRAESLAELDRAKTTFFSNVSHEFRTPLTLMLGPVEDLLARPSERIFPENRELLEVVHRNGLRLQKLVNTLLDFSRIEAGRVQASYEPTDLAAFTAELASCFRSACQRAGLELVVSCPPLAEPVYVDREMWEKIVLNLLSNAFKFTLQGRIEVALRQVGPVVELAVRDTGVGIPAEQMAHLFERFHRVEEVRGRTQEGSGIGLALVRELVHLHGGEVRAESTLGQGSTFRVTLPLGTAHLPPERIKSQPTLASTALDVNAYVEEALRWLPSSKDEAGRMQEESSQSDSSFILPPSSLESRPHILLADDNADMREYITRLLAPRYQVTAVANGLAARDAAYEQPPDLVLSDVMMPGLDGFGLLRELRAHPETAAVPVLLLSARAGEEASVEGLKAGADDYLTKPFSARELLARVQAHLDLAKLRRESAAALRQSEERFRSLMEQAPFSIQIFGPDGHTVRANRVWEELWGVTVEQIADYNVLHDPQLEQKGIAPYLRRAFAGEAVEIPAVHYDPNETLPDRSRHRDPKRWVSAVAYPLKDAAGRVREVVLVHEDITARKHAEDELRATEQRWRHLAEALPNLVWTDTPDGQCDYLSSQWGRYTGIPEQELLGMSWLERVLHPDDRERTRACWLAAVAGRGEYDLEYRIRRHDGQYRWFKTRGVPIRDEQGRIVKWFGTCTDIEDQKQAVEELRRSEERFRQLADAMPQIVFAASPDGRADYLNRRWYEYSGQSEEETVSEGWLAAVHPDDQAACLAEAERTRQAGIPFEMELRLREGRSGQYRWHLARSLPVRDAGGQIVRWYGTSTDIHERKRTADASRFLADASATLASVADYESTLQKVAGLAVPYFADWSAVDVAGEGGALRRLAIFHQDPEKIRLAQELFRLYPPDPEAPSGHLHVFRTGKPEIVIDISDDMLVKGARDEQHLQMVRALGLRSYICVPLLVSGRPFGVLTFATAESGRNYSDADLALAEDLAHRAAVALDNARLYAELRQADRLKDEFLAMLAHELRNPLAPVRNALHILKEPHAGGDMRRQARDMAERQVQHMARLLDDLLDVSRISRGRIELRKEAVDVAVVIQRTVEAVRPLLEERRHQLVVSLPPVALQVEADPTRLEQVLTNLLNNAAKYTDPGGRIRVAAERDGDRAVVRVHDNGIGIEPAMLPRIFDLFVQAERRLDRSQGGVGIGLTLVKRLVELHGGRIEAHSAGPGQGSEFVVRLPATLTATEQAERKAADAGPRRPQSRRVLVVDDNPDAADSLALLLQLAGQEVRAAYDGTRALAVVPEFRPELIFLDIGMPGMDGYQVARRLQEQPGREAMVVVALTGWGQDTDRQRSAEAGFDHHLVKPVEPAVLQQLLDNLPRRS